jgi:surface polysaccharide O-acyltransferase-like enzyme
MIFKGLNSFGLWIIGLIFCLLLFLAYYNPEKPIGRLFFSISRKNYGIYLMAGAVNQRGNTNTLNV